MGKDYWDYGVEVVKRMKSPMRPNASEALAMREIMQERMESWSGRGGIRVLVLGVTREITGMNWPAGVEVSAVDESEGMIRAFWTPEIARGKRLIRGNWLDLGPSSGDFDFVFGDGVFNTLACPDGYHKLAAVIAARLKPGGLFIARVMCQADHKERLADIVQRYEAGEINDFGELRFRMHSASQASVEEGLQTTTQAIDRLLQEHGIDLQALYARTGYLPPVPPPAGQGPAPPPLKVTFPTRREFTEAVSAWFRVVDIRHGEHASAARCPVFGLEAVGPVSAQSPV